MIKTLFGPLFGVMPVVLVACVAVGEGAPKWILLLAAAWFGWCAYRSFGRSRFVYTAIARREPWRETYYDSLYHQGASRAVAYRDSSWAWLRDPLHFVINSLCCLSMVSCFFAPQHPNTSKVPLSVRPPAHMRRAR